MTIVNIFLLARAKRGDTFRCLSGGELILVLTASGNWRKDTKLLISEGIEEIRK